MPRKKAESPERAAKETRIPPVPDEVAEAQSLVDSWGTDLNNGISVPSDSTEVAPEDSEHPKYPHLERLERYDEVMRVKRVTITEKLDGANVRFGIDLDGQLWAGSRNQVLDLADRSASYGFVGWLLDSGLAERLEARSCRGIVYFGEWVGRKVQGRIKYPDEGFYLFDIFIPDHKDDVGNIHYILTTADHVDWHASQLNLRTVPRLYWGKPNLDTFQQYRDKPTSADVTEGIVIKADPPQRDFRGNWVIAKFKSPAFEEVAKAKKRTPRDPKDVAGAQAFVDQYVTLERLRHVFALVREEGADPTDIRETGTVLRTMHADVIREGLRDYQELGQTQQKAMGGLCARATKPLIEELILAEQQEAA